MLGGSSCDRARGTHSVLAGLLALGVSLFIYWVRRKECAGWEAVRVDMELIQVEHKDTPNYGEWISALDDLVNADGSLVNLQPRNWNLKDSLYDGLSG